MAHAMGYVLTPAPRAEIINGSVVSISVSSDGKYIVSASEDILVKIWNIKELREEFTVDFDMGP